MASEPPALAARDVHVRFGGVRAVDGVTVEVRPGSLTAIIGPNGAGKTTLFNVLAGYARPTSGRVELRGRDVTRLGAAARARLGLGRTFQIARSLARMTVLENLMLAPGPQLGERAPAALFLAPRVAEEERALRARAEETLRLFDLHDARDAYAGSLSGGQRKLLELARALMRDPEVVLLDEPMAGVNPTLARRLMDRIERVRTERGTTFVLVEHDLETVFARCDPVVVMAAGRKIAEGSADEVRRDPAVVEAYLGGSAR